MADQNGVEIVTIRDSDGEITDVATLKNGVLEGEALIYSAGRVVARMQFRQGKLNGPAVYYDDTGQVQIQSSYKDGKLHGDSLYFGPDGVLMRKSAFEAGLLHGYTVDYYPSGKAREVTTFQKNIREGEWLRLAEDGKVQERLHYRQGKPQALNDRPKPGPRPNHPK
jgi:uncharacterized protein